MGQSGSGLRRLAVYGRVLRPHLGLASREFTSLSSWQPSLGVAIGILMGWRRIFYGLTFPILEIVAADPDPGVDSARDPAAARARAADHRADFSGRVFRYDTQHAARRSIDRSGLFPGRTLARVRRARDPSPRHRAGSSALHLRGTADCHGRLLVLIGRFGDRLRPGRSRLQGMGDLLLRSVRDHGDHHGDSGLPRLRLERDRPHRRQPAHAMARRKCWRAYDGERNHVRTRRCAPDRACRKDLRSGRREGGRTSTMCRSRPCRGSSVSSSGRPVAARRRCSTRSPVSTSSPPEKSISTANCSRRPASACFPAPIAWSCSSRVRCSRGKRCCGT